MGLFDKLFGKNNTTATATATVASTTAPVMKIDMSKHAENLNTVLIDMFLRYGNDFKLVTLCLQAIFWVIHFLFILRLNS